MDWSEVADYLEGTCNSAHAAIARFDLECEVEEVEEAMLDQNLEICPFCHWWMECHELVNDEGDVVGCQQCREKEEED